MFVFNVHLRSLAEPSGALQSLGFLLRMVTCSFTLYLLISHRMKAGSSVYSFIHSFIKGKCSRRYKKAQESSVRLRKAPRPLSRDIDAQSDESDDTVGGLIPLDTLMPVTPRPGSPPPIPVPRRSVRLKQPPKWHTSGEFSMSLNDKLYELKSLLAFDGVDKSIITTAIVSLLVGSP